MSHFKTVQVDYLDLVISRFFCGILDGWVLASVWSLNRLDRCPQDWLTLRFSHTDSVHEISIAGLLWNIVQLSFLLWCDVCILYNLSLLTTLECFFRSDTLMMLWWLLGLVWVIWEERLELSLGQALAELIGVGLFSTDSISHLEDRLFFCLF